MKVILENTETGELKELYEHGKFQRPWRIKEIVPGENKPGKDMAARFAVFSTKLGLPVPQLLDAARWLLQKDCPYCQLGTKILRRIDELGENRSFELIKRILTAKANNDVGALDQIRREVNG